MESSRSVRASTIVLLIVFVFGFAIESSEAGFGRCYGECVLKCTLETFTPLTCAAKCVPQCLFHIGAPMSLIIENGAQSCTLRCATSKCSTIHSQDVEESEKCANGCLGSCITFSDKLN